MRTHSWLNSVCTSWYTNIGREAFGNSKGSTSYAIFHSLFIKWNQCCLIELCPDFCERHVKVCFPVDRHYLGISEYLHEFLAMFISHMVSLFFCLAAFPNLLKWLLILMLILLTTASVSAYPIHIAFLWHFQCGNYASFWC